MLLAIGIEKAAAIRQYCMVSRQRSTQRLPPAVYPSEDVTSKLRRACSCSIVCAAAVTEMLSALSSGLVLLCRVRSAHL